MASNGNANLECSGILQENKGQALKLARSKNEVIQLRLSVRKVAALSDEAQKCANCANNPFIMNACNTINVSKTSVKNLQITVLQHLRLEEANKGVYLILRILEAAYSRSCITTAVEDHEGNAVLFSAYNFTADPNPNLDDILPVGTVFILKEPYIKISLYGETLLRCDCPSDMIVLYKGHELFSLAEDIVWQNVIDPKLAFDFVWRQPEPKTATEWKLRGIELYKQKKVEHAIRCYLLGLKNLAKLGDNGPLVEQFLHLNLSSAYLELGYFEKSLEFAEKVLMADPVNRKALFTAGKSCNELRKYEDAKRYLDKGHDLYPDDEDTNVEWQLSHEPFLVPETGEFNMFLLFLTDRRLSNKKILCVERVGPITVTAIEGKGRGVVASRDIDPGTLLAVSRALVFAWPLENTGFTGGERPECDHTCRLGSRIDVVAELAQLIARNPNVYGPIVYDLSDGSERVNNEPVALFCDPDTKQEPIVDVQRLKGILNKNAYFGMSNIFNLKDSDGTMGSKMYAFPQGGTGVFTVPSYFNHACLHNAMYHTFNDVMFVRAIKFIKAGEEVCLPYCSPELPYLQRQDFCEKRGFRCSCNFCIQEGSLPKSIHNTRESIISRFTEVVGQMNSEFAHANHASVQCKLKNLITEMEATYNNSETPLLKPGLSLMYLSLAHAYICNMDAFPRNCDFRREIVECHHKTIALFGFCPKNLMAGFEKGENLIPRNAHLGFNVFAAISGLITIYHETGQFELKNKWVNILCALEKVFSGGDIRAIKLKYVSLSDII